MGASIIAAARIVTRRWQRDVGSGGKDIALRVLVRSTIHLPRVSLVRGEPRKIVANLHANQKRQLPQEEKRHENDQSLNRVEDIRIY